MKLRITSESSVHSKGAQTAVFGTAGGTIGRDARNDMVLPDPEKIVSSTHARISCRGESFFIQDESTNGLCINAPSNPIGKGTVTELNNNDELYIGDYVLRVQIEKSGPVDAQRITADAKQDFNVSHITALKTDDPFAFDDIRVDPPVSTVGDTLDLRAGNRKAEVIGPQSDHSPAVNHHYKPPPTVPANPVADEVIPEYWFTSPDPTLKTPKPQARNDGTHASQPPLVIQQIKENGVLNDRKGLFKDAAYDGTLLQAFLRGAGIYDIPNRSCSDQEVMALAGSLFRELVLALMQILTARASLKNELRIPLTLLKKQENNPLKFSMSVEEAMTHLLLQCGSGCMLPIPSVNEVHQDLKDHQIAMIAAMQVAYAALIERFNPSVLEENLKRESTSTFTRAFRRRFSLWKHYCEYFDRLTVDSADAFKNLFGNEFVKAYEEQVNRLVRGRELGQSDF